MRYLQRNAETGIWEEVEADEEGQLEASRVARGIQGYVEPYGEAAIAQGAQGIADIAVREITANMSPDTTDTTLQFVNAGTYAAFSALTTFLSTVRQMRSNFVGQSLQTAGVFLAGDAIAQYIDIRGEVGAIGAPTEARRLARMRRQSLRSAQRRGRTGGSTRERTDRSLEAGHRGPTARDFQAADLVTSNLVGGM